MAGGLGWLDVIFSNYSGNSLVKTSSVVLDSEEHAKEEYNNYLKLGYEGMMIRNTESLYQEKRSYDLQKFKPFEDDEFPIVGIEEGRGKLRGHVAAFVCEGKDGNTFKAKLDGNTSFLKECFNNSGLWEGKKLTVRYQGLTTKSGVPRFPVGKSIRDYE